MNDVLPARSCWDTFPNCLPAGLEAMASCLGRDLGQGNLQSQVPSRLPLGYDPQKDNPSRLAVVLDLDTRESLTPPLDRLEAVIFFILPIFLPEYGRGQCIYTLHSLPSFTHSTNVYEGPIMCQVLSLA